MMSLLRFIEPIYNWIKGTDTTSAPNFKLTGSSVSIPIRQVDSGVLLQKLGAWCWFSYPQAIKYDNYTFFGFVTPLGEVKVGRYDHINKVVDTFTIMTAEADDHNVPAIIRLASGKIAVFYARHNQDNLLRYRISTSDNGIDFQAEQTLASSGLVTYAQVHMFTTNNKIVVFYRVDVTKWACRVSDNGATWSNEKIVFQFPVQGYIKSDIRPAGNIILVGLTTHPDRIADDHNLYACYIKDTLEVVDATPNGLLLGNINTEEGLPINIASCTKIYDWTVTGEKAWIWDARSYMTGYGCFLFSALSSQFSHKYKYAVATGNLWSTGTILNDAGGTISDSREPSYSGGLTLPRDSTFYRLFLSRKTELGKWVIEEWRTSDKGSTWFSRLIAEDDGFKLVRPIAVVNGSDDMVVMWLSGGYTYYLNEFATDIRYHAY